MRSHLLARAASAATSLTIGVGNGSGSDGEFDPSNLCLSASKSVVVGTPAATNAESLTHHPINKMMRVSFFMARQFATKKSIPRAPKVIPQARIRAVSFLTDAGPTLQI